MDSPVTEATSGISCCDYQHPVPWNPVQLSGTHGGRESVSELLFSPSKPTRGFHARSVVKKLLLILKILHDLNIL